MPTYLPKICRTLASFGFTMKNPPQHKRLRAKTTTQKTTTQAFDGGWTAEMNLRTVTTRTASWTGSMTHPDMAFDSISRTMDGPP